MRLANPSKLANSKRKQRGMILKSTITCPSCQHEATETMPTDACQFFYACAGCGTRLKPKPGDCCVFCSYGNVPCPPIQENGKGVCCS
jgi:hypothetical protein